MRTPVEFKDPDPFFPASWTGKPEDKKAKHVVWMFRGYVPDQIQGASCMTHAINQYLIKKGWTCTVLVPEHSMTRYQGVHIIKFHEKQKAQKAIREASVFVCYLRHQEFMAALAKQAGVPFVLLNHNAYQIPYIRDCLSIVGPEHFYMIHNSQWLSDFYKRNLQRIKTPAVRGFLPHYAQQTQIVFPPIDFSRFRFPVRGSKVTLVNCSHEKGADVFFRLAKAMPDVEFLAVEGGYNESVREDGLANVTYMKNTPDIRKFYEQTRVILMPSKEESWGRVAVEAMALGIPVIATPVEGLLESLGEAGLFASPKYLHVWERMIRRLFQDPWFYALKSLEGKSRAQELQAAQHTQLENLEKWLSEIK